MISWIQRYFQHHFRILFGILLVVVIISFVFVIGASPGISPSERGLVDRPYFGYNLSLPEDQGRVFGDAQVSAQLKFGAYAGVGAEQIQSYALSRAAALHLANEWHIPAATPAEITAEIKNLRMFSGPDGQFDAKTYATFRDNLKTQPRGLTEADIARVLGDDIRADKVSKLLAGPGYVLPADIKTQLQRADTTWTLGTATVDYASFQVDLKPGDAEIKQFFEQSGGRYDIAPRVVTNYVEFASSAFLPGVTVTEAEVRAYYDENPARFPKPAAPQPADATTPVPPADPAADFAAVRSQVETSLKNMRAQNLAVKAASKFALDLYEAFKNRTPDPAAFEGFLAARKLELKPLAPFTQEASPAVLGGSPEVAAQAFKLGPQRFASEAFPTPAGAALLFWKDTQPSRTPLLTEVREKVLADYLENEKRKRFVELGRTIKGQLETRLKTGDTMEKAAAAAATATGAKIEARTLPAFLLRDRPTDLDYSVLGALERLEQGQVSDMVINADKGIFVFAAEKKGPVLDESNPRYLEARTQLASLASRVTGQAHISELVQNELKKSEPKAP